MNLHLKCSAIDSYIVSGINNDLVHLLFEVDCGMRGVIVHSIAGISVRNLPKVIVSILPFQT